MQDGEQDEGYFYTMDNFLTMMKVAHDGWSSREKMNHIEKDLKEVVVKSGVTGQLGVQHSNLPQFASHKYTRSLNAAVNISDIVVRHRFSALSFLTMMR